MLTILASSRSHTVAPAVVLAVFVGIGVLIVLIGLDLYRLHGRLRWMKENPPPKRPRPTPLSGGAVGADLPRLLADDLREKARGGPHRW